jgi:hypothetical protein
VENLGHDKIQRPGTTTSDVQPMSPIKSRNGTGVSSMEGFADADFTSLEVDLPRDTISRPSTTSLTAKKRGGGSSHASAGKLK